MEDVNLMERVVLRCIVNTPKTPVKQITNMRNFLIHGYHNVEEDLVWEAISVDLPPIREQIVKYLEEYNDHMGGADTAALMHCKNSRNTRGI